MRPWETRRHVEIARRMRSAAPAAFKALPVPRTTITVVAVREVNSIIIGYWAGPVAHVRGRVKHVTLDKAFTQTNEAAMRSALVGCDLDSYYRVARVNRQDR